MIVFGGVDGDGELRDSLQQLSPPVCPAAAGGAQHDAPAASRACLDCVAGTRVVTIHHEDGSAAAASARSPLEAAVLTRSAHAHDAHDAHDAHNATGVAAGLTSPALTTHCVPCEAGWLSERAGSLSCSPCPRGTYAPWPGSTSWEACQLCPAGKYAPRPGSRECTPCRGTVRVVEQQQQRLSESDDALTTTSKPE